MHQMQLYLLINQFIYLFLSDFMSIVDDISKSIIKASTTLSQDKESALKKAILNEDNDNAKWALNQILENYKVAKKINFLYVMTLEFLT